MKTKTVYRFSPANSFEYAGEAIENIYQTYTQTPADTTPKHPLSAKSGFAVCFDLQKDDWVYVVNNVGRKYWLSTDSFGAAAKKITKLGEELPKGALFEAPAKTLKQHKEEATNAIQSLHVSLLNAATKGNEGVYLDKYTIAKAFASSNYSGDVHAYISGWAKISGKSNKDAADDIIARGNLLSDLRVTAENLRIQDQIKINSATTSHDVAEILGSYQENRKRILAAIA